MQDKKKYLKPNKKEKEEAKESLQFLFNSSKIV
jgi:hypothetical protein